METGSDYAIRPAGILALDVVRVEAGLIMAGVDYTSVHHALTREQSYSPYELGLGEPGEAGQGRALRGPGRRCGARPRPVVRRAAWSGSTSTGPTSSGSTPGTGSRLPSRPTPGVDEIPIYDFGAQVGRATSGSWSLVLKKNLAIGTVAAASAEIGTELEMEWSVEGERGTIGAEVVALPFFDPPRKRE